MERGGEGVRLSKKGFGERQRDEDKGDRALAATS